VSTKNVFYRHTLTEEDFFRRYTYERNDGNEEGWEAFRDQFNALPQDKRQAIYDNWLSHHGYDINGEDEDGETNRLEQYDEEVDDDDSVRDGDDDGYDNGGVHDDLLDSQDSTWKMLTEALLTPADLVKHQQKALEAEIVALDERFVARAEALKAQFMKEMAKVRKDTEEAQSKLRTALTDLKVKAITDAAQ
jgi:hypothetical protein